MMPRVPGTGTRSCAAHALTGGLLPPQCLWYNSNKLTKCRKEEKAFKEKCKPADAGPDPRAVVAAASPRE